MQLLTLVPYTTIFYKAFWVLGQIDIGGKLQKAILLNKIERDLLSQQTEERAGGERWH
jgi:hypothetical protein